MDNIDKAKAYAMESISKWLLGKIDAPEYPIQMQIEISNICNIKCAMCNTFSPFTKSGGCLSLDESGFIQEKFIQKLESILPYIHYLSLFGYGEPLIYPYFEKVIKLVGKYKIYTTFFTNAKRLDKEIARILVDNKVGKITISFSGADKETYENIYLGSNFENTLENIKYLAKYKKQNKTKFPMIEINSLGFQDHVDKFDQFVEVLGKIGVDIIFLSPLFEYVDIIPELHGKAAVVRPEIEGEIIKRAKEIAQKYNVQIVDNLSVNYTATNEKQYAEMKSVLSCNPNKDVLFEDIPLNTFRQRMKNKKGGGCLSKKITLNSYDFEHDSKDVIRKNLNAKKLDADMYCSQPFTAMYVLQNGMIKPCCNMPTPLSSSDDQKMLGDLEKNSIEDIWSGRPFQVFREIIIDGLYPADACTRCIALKGYPPETSFINILQEYLNWYKESFKSNLLNSHVKNLLNILNDSSYRARIKNRQNAK